MDISQLVQSSRPKRSSHLVKAGASRRAVAFEQVDPSPSAIGLEWAPTAVACAIGTANGGGGDEPYRPQALSLELAVFDQGPDATGRYAETVRSLGNG
ncbi:MAG: hypothetical protein WCF24_04085 [Acidimicrobiales bacterium]